MEAVNFDNFIYDTNDLSTIRGGGLLVLDAAKTLGVEAIFTGASTGLFSIDLPNDEAAVERCGQWKKALESGACEEATFVVDFCETGGQFPEDLALVTAKNKWNQIKSPSRILPPAQNEGSCCELDAVRPAGDEQVFRKGAAFIEEEGKRKQWISKTVNAKREVGVGQKHIGFYKDRAPSIFEQFASDLNQIGDLKDAGKLNGKVALIYLDGNKFGKKLAASKSKEEAAAFSKSIIDTHEGFLKWLIGSIPNDADNSPWLWTGYVIDNNGREIRKRRAVRLETLLWGGDEIIWVVPAWQGWWVLGQFFERYGQYADRKDLTYSASVVFCHSDAHVKRIGELAKGLVEKPKSLPDDKTPERNLFCYQTLESFDHLGNDPDEFRSGIVRHMETDHLALVLEGGAMVEIGQAVRALKNCVAKSKLVEVVTTLYRDQEVENGLKLGEDLLKKTRKDFPEAKVEENIGVLRERSCLFAKAITPELQKAVAWLHLAELWDYLPEREGGL